VSAHDEILEPDDGPLASGTSRAGEPIEPAFRSAAQVDPRLLASTRRQGCFVTFEGIEGSGKSTQIARLAERLDGAGEPTFVTREPGGSPLGRRLRGLLLGGEIARIEPLAELCLYVADRAQHLREFVEPNLASGTHVLCDRYLDATLAYQGFARGLDLDYIRLLHEKPPLDRRPHRTILLDLDPELGLDRARRRNDELGLETTEGRFERETIAFHRRVREGYLSLAEAEPFRFRIVAAEGTAEEIEARVADLLSDLFPGLDDEDAS
jgi:dTMP kinase